VMALWPRLPKLLLLLLLHPHPKLHPHLHPLLHLLRHPLRHPPLLPR
jgi:hypothetical protein